MLSLVEATQMHPSTDLDWYYYYQDLVLARYQDYIDDGHMSDENFAYYGLFDNPEDLEAAIDGYLLELTPEQVHCEGSCLNSVELPHYIYSVYCIVDTTIHLITFVSSKISPTYIEDLIQNKNEEILASPFQQIPSGATRQQIIFGSS